MPDARQYPDSSGKINIEQRVMPARMKLRQIVASVAAKHGLSEGDIYLRDRTAPMVAARHEAWAKCREAGFTLQAIAGLAGWDHTSILTGVRRFYERQTA